MTAMIHHLTVSNPDLPSVSLRQIQQVAERFTDRFPGLEPAKACTMARDILKISAEEKNSPVSPGVVLQFGAAS